MVGDGAGRLPHGFEVVNRRSIRQAPSKAVLGMHMQMGKLSLGGFRHGQVSLVLSARVGFFGFSGFVQAAGSLLDAF